MTTPDDARTLGDPARLQALAQSGLLDSAAEEAFDRLTRLAAKILGVPVALVSLVDDHRQFFKSAVGLGEPWASRRETPLTHSFCQYAVVSGAPLVVADAREHPLVRDNLAVPDLGVIAYAGVPLITSQALALGALCVIETKPREWTADEVEILRELACSVVSEIELRLAVKASAARAAEAESARGRAAAAEQRYRDLIAGLDAVVWEASFATGRMTYVSPQCEALTGVATQRWLDAPAFAREFILPDDVPAVTDCYRAVWLGRETDVECRVPTAAATTLWLRGRMRPMRDAAGGVSGVRGVLVDVSARKQIELALDAQTAAVALLQAVAVAANEATSSEAAMQQCLGLLCAFLGWPIGHAYVKRGEALEPTDLWHLAHPERFGPFRELTAQTRLVAMEGLPGQVLATGQAGWINDVGSDPGFPRATVARAVGIRGGLACPVLVGDEVVAVLEFYSDEVATTDERTRALLTNVGTQLGRVVERERHAALVEGRAVTDELTGLHNRRGFLALAEQALHAATRAKAAAQLCFIDMDGLKVINDVYGHATGDQAIVELAGVLRRTFRATDVVARLGGDEFVVLATLGPGGTGSALVDHLHAQLAAHNAVVARPYTLAVSVGLTAYDPARPEPVEALLARADALMYAQKRQRRGRRRTNPPP